MKKFSDILPHALGQLGIRKQYQEKSVAAHWREIAGEEIYAHARVIAVNRGVLLVAVDNSAWCHHLSIIKQEIIHKVNAFLEEKHITDIRFKAGYLQNCQNEENVGDKIDAAAKLNAIKLSTAEQQYAQQMAGLVKNQALKRKINSVLKKELKLRKIKANENWQQCACCTVLCPPGEKMCAACSLEQKIRERQKIRQILSEVPWLDYAGMCSFVACSEKNFHFVKQELMAELAQKISQSGEDGIEIYTYIMLRHQKKPEQIGAELVAYTLQSLRRKKYVSAPGSQHRYSHEESNIHCGHQVGKSRD
ncbi:MAG: DUF721 domain-containing protein [Negativicutes bacterium]|nr:DUF721 domain-containing protein [Negativicutes bacterium]